MGPKTIKVMFEKDKGNEYIIEYITDLMKKDIPKKPDLEADAYVNGEPFYEYAHCPRCRAFMDLEFDEKTPYCPYCGQRLDWSDYYDS